MLINRTLRATALLIVFTSSGCGLGGDGDGLFDGGSGNPVITVDALADVLIRPSVPTRVGSSPGGAVNSYGAPGERCHFHRGGARYRRALPQQCELAMANA